MLNIPEDYEAYKMNCIAGEESVSILARRPDGGVSDIVKKMNRKAHDGVCPACGSDMQIIGIGQFTCSNGHIQIHMTNKDASLAHFGRYKGDHTMYRGVSVKGRKPITRKVSKRIMPKRKHEFGFPPSLNVNMLKNEQTEGAQNIEDKVRNAMKEAMN